MRLVTWNVNSIKARLPRVLEFLERHAPDVLLMQETKCGATAFPHEAFVAAGYRAEEYSAGQWAGVAIVARAGLPMADVVRGLPGEPSPEEARWIEARVGGLLVASVYVPNGRSRASPEFPRKLVFLDAMRQRAGLDVIGGDFNVARHDLDVFSPAAFVGGTHVSPAERGRLEALLDAGFVDAYRTLHPQEVGFTWWDYRGGSFHRNLGMRIDYLLFEESLAPRLQGCGIEREFRKGTKPSDHVPLLAELADG